MMLLQRLCPNPNMPKRKQKPKMFLTPGQELMESKFRRQYIFLTKGLSNTFACLQKVKN
uniref:Uncharacterized protein n=1 Tax=Rhizophora mucronata TaxID=61149 RepID=A0A2P2QQC6_RHIMU